MSMPGLRSIWSLLKDPAIACDKDNIVRQGAALVFFSVFSLSPLLILVIVFSSVGVGQEAALWISSINTRVAIGGIVFNVKSHRGGMKP